MCFVYLSVWVSYNLLRLLILAKIPRNNVITIISSILLCFLYFFLFVRLHMFVNNFLHFSKMWLPIWVFYNLLRLLIPRNNVITIISSNLLCFLFVFLFCHVSHFLQTWYFVLALCLCVCLSVFPLECLIVCLSVLQIIKIVNSYKNSSK